MLVAKNRPTSVRAAQDPHPAPFDTAEQNESPETGRAAPGLPGTLEFKTPQRQIVPVGDSGKQYGNLLFTDTTAKLFEGPAPGTTAHMHLHVAGPERALVE